MKALVYTGPEQLEVRDAAEPSFAADQILLNLAGCGICGSDMHAYLGHDERRPAPLILGHETAGVDADGGRWTVNPLVSDPTSRATREGRDNLCPNRQIISMPPREGAFAERLAMRRENLVAVPDHVPLTKAALAEPLACGWHAMRLAERVSHTAIEDATCLAIGGGAIGLGAALALRAAGAKEVWLAETNPLRREIVAREDGVRVFDPVTDKAPEAEIVIDGVGLEPTRALSSAAATPGGVILHIGLGSAAGGLDIRRMTLQEITFIGTYTYTMAHFRETAEAIFDGRLGDLDWIEERALEDGAAAFEDIRAGRAAAPKIILTP
ncbi:MAG: alcohol dehydrogenase catalytic domain-containing protein [Pseudomonadota bacterium]